MATKMGINANIGVNDEYCVMIYVVEAEGVLSFSLCRLKRTDVALILARRDVA